MSASLGPWRSNHACCSWMSPSGSGCAYAGKSTRRAIKIVEQTRSTVVMVTHDVDEAIFLSDRVVMMTNGPAAKIGEVLDVDIPRPRDRLEMTRTPAYAECRRRLLEFLYLKQAAVRH